MISRFTNKAIWLFVHKIPWKPILIWGPWILALLVITFYGIENWRGGRAWDKARLEARQAGISLKLQDHLPPLSDKHLDASTLPILDGVKVRSFKKRIYNGDKGLSPKKHARSTTTSRNRWKAEPRDIRLWLDPAKGSLSPAEAAAELRKIAKPDLDRLHALVQQSRGHRLTYLPSSQNPTFEDISALSLMPSLSAWELAAEDTLLSLAEEDNEQAFANLEFMLKLVEKQSYPTFVNWLVTASGLLIFEHVLWEAIVSDCLTDSQLEALEQQLSLLSISEIISNTMEGELAYMRAWFEEAQANRKLWAESLALWHDVGLLSKIETGWSPADDVFLKIDLFLIARMPSGWLDFEKAELTSEVILIRNKLRDGGYSAVANHDFPKHKQRFIPNFSIPEIIPIVKKSVSGGMQLETRIRLARIGIALELFRRKHDSYPATLSELKPMDSLRLIDPYSEREFGYRLKQDQTPIVWSVGLNRIDENGIPGFHRKEGDIVWQLTPISGLSESDLEKELAKHRIK